MYPETPDEQEEALADDLGRAHIVAVLDSENVSAHMSAFEPSDRVVRSRSENTLPAQFHKFVADRARRVCEVTRPDANVGADVEDKDAKLRVMVKYSKPDTQPTKEMVARLKKAKLQCYASRNGASPFNRLREIPLDCLVYVLGECDDDWLDARQEEVIELEISLKDQVPQLAYYMPHGSDEAPLPPASDAEAIEVDGPNEIDALIARIKRGAK